MTGCSVILLSCTWIRRDLQSCRLSTSISSLRPNQRWPGEVHCIGCVPPAPRRTNLCFPQCTQLRDRHSSSSIWFGRLEVPAGCRKSGLMAWKPICCIIIQKQQCNWYLCLLTMRIKNNPNDNPPLHPEPYRSDSPLGGASRAGTRMRAKLKWKRLTVIFIFMEGIN